MRVKTLTWLSFWNEAQANECVCVCATKNLRHYQMATVASHTLSCKQSNAKLTWGSCGFVCGVFEKTSWRNPSTKNIRVRFLSPPLWRLVAVQATYQSTSTGLVKALASTKREAAKPCECLNSNYRQVILQRKILPNGHGSLAMLLTTAERHQKASKDCKRSSPVVIPQDFNCRAQHQQAA